jgi:glycosyltransferase involved in cell wall biosynthesis
MYYIVNICLIGQEMSKASIHNVFDYTNLCNATISYTKSRKIRVNVKKTTDDFTAIQYTMKVEPHATYKFQMVGRFRSNNTSQTRSKGVILWINGKYISNITFTHDHKDNYIYEHSTDKTTRELLISFVFIQPVKNNVLYLIDFSVARTVKQDLQRLTELEDIIEHRPNGKDVDVLVNQYMEKYKMTKELTVLICATQQPYQGGASTCAYNFIKLLRNYSIRCAGLFFIHNEEGEQSEVNIDPEEIGGVFLFRADIQTLIQEYLETPTPKLIMGFDFLAPKLLFNLFNYSTLAYIVTSSYHCNILSGEAISFVKYLKDTDTYQIDETVEISSEKDSIKDADYIITNSELAKLALKKFHSELESFITEEPINTTLLSINRQLLTHDINTNESFSQRTYDILYVVTDTLKQIKNPKFANDLFRSSHLRKVKKVVIGNNITYFSNTNNLKQLPVVSQSELFEYMSESKIIIIPSFYDSSPPLMYEAILNGCIPIISRNVGNSDILDRQIVCDDVYNKESWLTHINHVLKYGEKIQATLPNVYKLYVNELNKLNIAFELGIHVIE